MLETLRERLLSVQQDFTSGLKTLSDKSREVKVKSKPRTVPYLPKYSAGLELLSRYEDTWAALHRRAKECASAGELVDSEVVMLSAHWEKKTTSLIELQEQLQQLPGLIADLESMTANLAHLEASFEEVENRLLHLEDLCEQCELERCRHVQSQHLENYKKSKRSFAQALFVRCHVFKGSPLRACKTLPQSGFCSVLLCLCRSSCRNRSPQTPPPCLTPEPAALPRSPAPLHPAETSKARQGAGQHRARLTCRLLVRNPRISSGTSVPHTPPPHPSLLTRGLHAEV
ncbi:dysbindin isoform X3 [Heterocephalus glaber]|uniref:Dysbindin isoform X3 n=1 Tax=Heterocephalus glaber TaxID=10181 RepID=A0AAX6PAL6_HETGA|nr:dysbindin isoform X3 [Heterocephalus glaber]